MLQRSGKCRQKCWQPTADAVILHSLPSSRLPDFFRAELKISRNDVESRRGWTCSELITQRDPSILDKMLPNSFIGRFTHAGGKRGLSQVFVRRIHLHMYGLSHQQTEVLSPLNVQSGCLLLLHPFGGFPLLLTISYK